MRQPLITKVCGMRQADNIIEVERLGVDWMGFIFWPPSKRYVDSKPSYLPVRAKRVGVFVDADMDFIISHTNDFKLDVIQLHGNETPDMCLKLKGLFPTVKIVKAFGIDSRQTLLRTTDYEGVADYFLFDTATKLKGGSGKTFDHSLLDDYNGKTPFLLSGGLSLDNQPQTMAFTHPMLAGYDLNSRFETQPAVKDISLLRQYINNLAQQTNSLADNSQHSNQQ